MEKPRYPSHDQSLGLIRRVMSEDKHKIITIIHNNYLKNIREELLEEEANQLQQNNSEIVHIKATINGTVTIIMVDTGSNISLINQPELERIQANSRTPIPTLPINNIIIIGATGKQNKTVRKQVSLELDNQKSTIPIVFLVANGLPFSMLIGCDVLRRYSAVINLQKGVVLLTSEQGTWSANIINCNPTPTALNQDPGLKSYYCQRREPVSYTHLDVYKRQY